MADPGRAKRLAKRISTIVASAIEYEIKDPRLAGVTITDAKVTGDLHDATLYYTVLGRSLDEERTMPAPPRRSKSAKGTLRTRVGAAPVSGSPDAEFRARHRARCGEPDGGAARPRPGGRCRCGPDSAGSRSGQ